jgi:hypothetical protein
VAGFVFSIISSINHNFYGVWYLNEFKSSEYSRAYAAMQRTNLTPVNRIELAKNQREKLYQVSPALRELKSILESKNKFWFTGGDEIENGFLLWGLREAANEKGYYSSPQVANKYFKRVANEIISACEKGKIMCLDNNGSSLAPKIQIKDMPLYLKNWGNALKYVVTFEGLKSEPSYLFVGAGGVIFEKMTGENIETTTPKPPERTFYNTLMELVGKIYQYIMPVLFVVTVIILLISTVTSTRKTFLYWIILGLLSLVLARTLAVSLVDVILFKGINSGYLSPAYPFWIAASTLSLHLLKDRFQLTKD